jgi:chromosome partitioning protein
MGQIIASGNLKGGTGKTTIAVNLACALADRDLKLCVLDVDPQASACAWAGRGRLPVRVEPVPSIQVTGSSRWLSRAAELAQGVDILVIDLPPLIVSAMASTTMIADLMLVPITPSALDVAPTERVLRTIRIARETRHANRPKALLVPNRVDLQGHYNQATEAAVDSLHERWAPPIRYHTDHVNAFAVGDWVGAYAPASPAAQDIRALTDAALAMLGLERPRRATAARPAAGTRLRV